MIRPTISIKGKVSTNINIKGKVNASTIRIYPELENIEIVPTLEDQVFKSKKYGFEEIKLKGVDASIDEDIKPENIKEGAEILGVAGSFKGIDTSDATALSEDILVGKTAYVNNEKIEGTMEEYDGGYTGNVETKNDLEISFISSIDNSLGANIKKLPDKLTSIGKYAFYYSNIALTELPENVSSIGESAFGYCKKLSLTKLPDKLTSVERNAFLQCTKLKINEIPAGITKFTNYAFGYCSGLTSLTILGDVTEFEGQVFYSCGNLEKIVLPNITGVPILGNSVFASTQIIRSGYIYVPDNLIEDIKAATSWSAYVNQIKPISELEV